MTVNRALVNVAAVLAFLAVLLSLGAPPALAAPTYHTELAEYVDLYNANSGNVPAMVRRMFGGERINAHIALSGGGEEIIGLVTSSGDARITSYVAGGVDSPTMRVYVDSATVEGLMVSQSGSAVLEALPGLRIEGVGIVNAIKVFVLNIGLRLFGRFMR